jgi:hypothetical protein
METLKFGMTLLMTLGFATLFAQTAPAPQQQMPTFYHQIFLEEPIDTVTDIYYHEDSTAVKYQLSPDKKAIYLLDYDGERTIRIEYVKAGSPADMVKPHCHVHSLEHL